MEQVKLKASIRQEKGKQAVKKLRAGGLVPAIVYHRGEESVSITVPGKEISKIIHDSGGENVLVSLTIEKDKKAKARTVIIKDVHHDPVKRSILHVDFNEISMTEKIIVEVEVIAVGEAVGVKQEGGTLDHPLRELRIQCLPMDIPKHIDVDVSGLKLNQSIHVRDLVLSDKIKVLNDPDILLFQVKIHEEKVEDAALPTDQPELEVIREKKEEEGKAGAAPAEKSPAKGGSASGGKEEPKTEKK